MRWPRENIEAIFQDDRANAIVVYLSETVVAGNILVIYGSQGSHYAARKANATNPALSNQGLLGVAAFGGTQGEYLPLFVPLKLITGLDTSARALNDRVYLTAVGTYSYSGTLPVGFVAKVCATDGRIVLCPSLIEAVSGGGVLFNDLGNYWPIDTVQGLVDSLILLLGGTSATVRDYTDNAVLTDNETLVASLNELDQTFEDLAAAAWDAGGLPTALDNKGYVVGTGTEGLILAQAVPDLTVRMPTGCEVWSAAGHKRTVAASANLAGFAIPAPGLQRRDIVVINAAGVLTRRVGVEGAAPAADAILVAGDVPLARVTLTQGVDVAVQAGNIRDLRCRTGIVGAAKALYADVGGYYDRPADPDRKLTVSEALDQIGALAWSLTPSRSYTVFDDFDTYQAGFTEIDHGALLHGDTNDPDIAATPLAGGVIELTTAAGAGDRCQWVWPVPIRLGTDGLVADFRIMVNNIVGVALFVGFTDVSTIENPCEVGVGTDVLAPNATDLLGVVFDSQGTTQRFHAAAFDGGVGDAGNGLFAVGGAPINGAWRRIVILSDDTGENLTFRVFDRANNLLAQRTMAGSTGCDANTDLFATVIVEARGAAARTLSVDWVYGRAGRA